MVCSLFIEGGGYYFSLYIPLHIRNFFRSFIYKKNHKYHFRMVCSDGVGDLLHQYRLTCTWRSYNKGSLSFSNRTEKIYNSCGKFGFLSFFLDFQVKALIWEERCKSIERSTDLCHLRFFAIYRNDSYDGCRLLILPWSSDLAEDCIPGL